MRYWVLVGLMCVPGTESVLVRAGMGLRVLVERSVVDFCDTPLNSESAEGSESRITIGIGVV